MLPSARPAATPTYPFACGPQAVIDKANAAVHRCRVDVRFQKADQGQVLIFLVKGGGGRRRVDCLSRWIASQPVDGFQRYGFVGRE
jgi:hypothetical protein